MPASKMGGLNFRKLMADFSKRDSVKAATLMDAIELATTNDVPGAVRLMFEVIRDEGLDGKIHALLSAADVDEAMEIYLNEIKPALTSGKGNDNK